MKTFRLIGMAVIAAIMSISFAACSDDDENNDNGGNGGGNSSVNPKNVFTNGIPKQVADMKISQNAQGLITNIESEDAIVTFEYPKVSTRAALANTQVKMTVKKDTGTEWEETFIFDMEIGSNGFVKHCNETEEDGDLETWDFVYSTEGNMTQMTRSEGGNEITTITYKDGNVTQTSNVSKDEPNVSGRYNIDYTSDAVKTPIENKGCLMLFDMTLGIDMDEMEFAYYAGLLGKATKNLPVKQTYSSDKVNYTEDYSWTLNADGFPTQLSIKESFYPEEVKIYFKW